MHNVLHAPVAKTYKCKRCKKPVAEWPRDGKCVHCKAFNSIALVKGNDPSLSKSFENDEPELLSKVERQAHERISTGTRELDRVLGGGLVIGSVVLISGDPGIGKSTLLLQVGIDLTLAQITDKVTNKPEDPYVVYYVSAEETKSQVKSRADRLSKDSNLFYLHHEADVVEIGRQIVEIKPDVVFVDSIQTMTHPDVEGSAGSVAQVKACADFLVGIGKAHDIAMFIVAHINKEGVVAGPKTLEHLVDATLEFHKEGQGELRSVRASKNRFGDTNEMALFRMTKDGLVSIENPSELLLEHHQDGITGTCIGFAAAGVRPIAVEVQALLSGEDFDDEDDEDEDDDGIPRRRWRRKRRKTQVVMGADTKRVNHVRAILQKRAGVDVAMRLALFDDTRVNIPGGMEFSDPGLDLPIALALISSAMDIALPSSFAAFGEIGLGGEIRPVSYLEARIKAACLMEFETIVGPYSSTLDFLNEPEKKEKDDETKRSGGQPESEADAEALLDMQERYTPVENLEDLLEEILEYEVERKKARQAKKPKKKKKKPAQAAAATEAASPPPAAPEAGRAAAPEEKPEALTPEALDLPPTG